MAAVSLHSDGRSDDSPSKWEWPTVRSTNPDAMVPGSAVTTTTQQQPWGAAENHLPPRGDITDLMPPESKAQAMEIVTSKTERLSNGFSDHTPKEAGDIDTTKRNTFVDRDSRRDEEREGEGEREGEKRNSEGEKRNSEGSDEELRQSVGSVTSSEFNPSVFGAVRGEEMRHEGEGGVSEGPVRDKGGATTVDTTVHQVCLCVFVCVRVRECNHYNYLLLSATSSCGCSVQFLLPTNCHRTSTG